MNKIAMERRSPTDLSKMIKSYYISFNLNNILLSSHSGYYRIMERSAGEWQTKCIKKSDKPTQQFLQSICEELGFPNTTNVSYHLLDPQQIVLNSEYRDPVKIVSNVLPSHVKLNDKFQLKSFQLSRKPTKVMPWNDIDKANCNQLEINCGA